MAKIRTQTRLTPARIRQALVQGLAVSGIDAKVETEAVKGTLLQRVLVQAKKFRELSHTERQDLLWRIMDQSFTPDEQLQISMILTLTPDELNGK